MRLVVSYTKQVNKFLKKNTHILTERKLLAFSKKAVEVLILHKQSNLDLKSLKGEYKGLYRIRHKGVRIIFKIERRQDKVTLIVVAVDYRGNIY